MGIFLSVLGVAAGYVLMGVFFALKERARRGPAAPQAAADQTSQDAAVVDPGIYDADYYLERVADKDLDNLPVSLKRCFDMAALSVEEKVLDIGSGTGQLAYYCVSKGCTAVAVDYSEAACQLANGSKAALPEPLREKMTVLKMDFRDLPEDVKYDVIFMADLVEHLYDWQLKALFEKMARILAPGTGRIVIHTAPNRYFIDIIFPLKRILNWPAVIRKTGPKGSFFYTRNKYFYDPAMHVNEQTPGSLSRHLRGFNARIWCDDGSANVLSMLTKSFAGADIWAVARSR